MKPSTLPDTSSPARGSPEAAFESLGEQRAKDMSEPMAAHRERPAPTAARPRLLIWLAALRQQRPAAPALVLAAIFATGLAAWNFYPSKPPAVRPLPDKPSIAVLPFKNLSGDPKQEYVVDGITGHLTAALSYFRDLVVIASSSTAKYKGEEVHAQQAGQELGVRYIL